MTVILVGVVYEARVLNPVDLLNIFAGILRRSTSPFSVLSVSCGIALSVPSLSHSDGALIEALRFAHRTLQPFEQHSLAGVAVRQA